ncbi:MAG: hypothetical protein KY444_00135 [Gemmatimonadetes bacterium]|nr:hypothetical protein [Gemmatimonadota bacterium]
MRRAARITGFITLCAAAAGCSGDRPPRVRDVTLNGARPLVTSESELLGRPSDVAVDERSRVYVLDYQMDRIVVLDGANPPRVVGRSGSGPGEIKGATSLAVSHDTLRIVDRGNGRIQMLTADGRYARSYGLAKQTMGSEASISRTGATAFATYGIQSQALARVFDGAGRMRSELGRVVAPSDGVWDLTALKQEIANGRVPRSLLNRARPVLGREGAWLVHLAEPTVARYDAQGALLWSRTLDSPDLNRVRENFFAKNRAGDATERVLSPDDVQRRGAGR